MSYPFQSMPTLDEIKQRLFARYGIRWVDQPDPTGQTESGYFERTLNGKTFGCPVSIKRGGYLQPRLMHLIYRRLEIEDDPFPLESTQIN